MNHFSLFILAEARKVYRRFTQSFLRNFAERTQRKSARTIFLHCQFKVLGLLR
jgi:hypothetical protein